MTAIEILAFIFSLVILLKTILWLLAPQKLLYYAERMIKHISLITGIYGIATLIIGYYILKEFTIIEVAAIGLLIVLVIKIGILPLTQDLLKQTKRNLKEYQKRIWFPLLIWTIFALWILITLLR